MGEGKKVQEMVLAAANTERPFSIDDLSNDLDRLTRRQVANGVVGLMCREYFQRHDDGGYVLTKSGIAAKQSGKPIKSGPYRPLTQKRVRKRRKRTFRQRVWSALGVKEKGQSVFTVKDIRTLVETGVEKNPANNIQNFIRVLVKAGYVQVMPRRQTGAAMTSNGFKRFRVLRWTGPDAPRLKAGRDGARPILFDPNTEESIHV